MHLLLSPGQRRLHERTAAIKRQFDEMREILHRKWPKAGYIAYFQAYTNTYAPLDQLKALYEQALELDGVVGLSIATRPDCLPDKTAAYLHDLAKQTFLTIELGLQSIHDATARRINRCHTYQEFLDGYRKLEGISRCVHIINGLPGENADMMRQTAQAVGSLAPEQIKIHLLHVIRGTALAAEYERGEFEAMTLSDYVNIVCDQLERLPGDTVIGRVTGDGVKEDLIAPLWSLKKFVVMNEIDKELKRRDSWQGKFRNDEDERRKYEKTENRAQKLNDDAVFNSHMLNKPKSGWRRSVEIQQSHDKHIKNGSNNNLGKGLNDRYL